MSKNKIDDITFSSEPKTTRDRAAKAAGQMISGKITGNKNDQVNGFAKLAGSILGSVINSFLKDK
ncbi:hypothetical protein [Marinifilum fragile]|uniref:hypothetical protein n=1 Tax=Marinifilum fragile TaxID=570161 RepID=UPI002AA74C38|nr:hypothetical protein [Marinifilum fragile]